MSSSRRFNVRVSECSYLRCQLKLGPGGNDGGTTWFADGEMQQLMAIIHAELPRRLPPLLDRPQQASSHPEIVRGDSIQVCLMFIPFSTPCWLLCDSHGTGMQAGGQVLAPRRDTYTPVVYTLLLIVEPFNSNSTEPQSMKTAPRQATIAHRGLTGYFSKPVSS